MKSLKFLLIMFLLTSCAYIYGQLNANQQVIVETPYAEGAKCYASDKFSRYIWMPPTPSLITLRLDAAPVRISCVKEGYKDTTKEFFPSMLPNEVDIPEDKSIFMDDTEKIIREKAQGKFYPRKLRIWMEPEWWRSIYEKNQWMHEKIEDEKIWKSR